MGSVSGDSTWSSSQYLTFDATTGTFNVTGAGILQFYKGGITTGAGTGTVGISGGATVDVTAGTDTFNAKLKVGDGSTTGTFDREDLYGNVTGGGQIVVSSTGTFKMTQTEDVSSPAGGLVQAGTSAGTFSNDGTFIRDGATTTGAYDVQLDYAVVNRSEFQVTASSSIKLTRVNSDGNSIVNNSGGTMDLFYGA